jgi:pimeloyl-ACP methyl ester carboxylesterase
VIIYDEFGLFRDNADEAGIPWTGPPKVRREVVRMPTGQHLSALVWGEGDPELVLVHGGAQNAHTWDTVALALGVPLVAVDLPGHGHSDWREDRRYGPLENGIALASVVAQLAPHAAAVVGMSLGGLSSLVLAARHPELVRRLVLVDVTPGVDHAKAKAVIDFVRGPEWFADFDEILRRTIEHNPTRSESSLRRGVLHNAMGLPDGRWTWRYDRRFAEGDSTSTADGAAAHATAPGAGVTVDFGQLWDDLERVTAPLLLCRGSLSPVVDDADVAELLRRQPGARVEVVEGAGHSIQGDRPIELARILAGFAGLTTVV